MTDDAPQTSSLHLKENLQGRIDNLAMSPSYANTLIPMFEAMILLRLLSCSCVSLAK